MPEDLDAWEQRTGVQDQPGDVLLVRTGRWGREQQLGSWNVGEERAGLHASAAKWLRVRDVAALGCDGTNDVAPLGVEGFRSPIHFLALVGLGMPLFDNIDLEALAREAVTRNRWEFLFIAAPLRIPGGTGSPLNPIAIF